MTDIDPMISSRCFAKAQACLWTIERRTLMFSGANYVTDIAPRDREIIDAGKMCDCFMWMSTASAPMPVDLSAYNDLAECFQCLATVLTVFGDNKRAIVVDHSLRNEVLKIVAESQSALRGAVKAVWGVPDQDQVDTYCWVRRVVNEHRCYIERYMRDDDPADHKAWKDLNRRIAQFCEQVERRTAKLHNKRRLVDNCRDQVERMIVPESTNSYPLINAAAGLLEGKKLVLIGGDVRKSAKEAIEHELHLDELVWLSAKHGQSVSSFERYIAQTNVSAVLVGIRLSKHAFSGLRIICHKHGKPLVRLSTGYSPNQVAAQLLKQASTQLRKLASRLS